MSPRRDSVRGIDWPAGQSEPIGTPLQPSVVYAAASVDALNDQYEGRAKGFTYSREGHPNAVVAAAKIDALEGTAGGMMTGSGMAAVSATALALLQAGDHMVGGDQLYGRSLRLLSEELPRLGIATTLADPTNPDAIEAALRPETKMILVEVVSNPTLRVADMDAIARLAQARGILLAVDNTFTTPLAFRPFKHGADIVIHSVTKLLAGHSDAMLGYVAARAPEHAEAIWTTIVTMGFTASPYDCWMAERGLHTFELRTARAASNAARLADHLAGTPGVVRVLYPNRADHPDHARAQKLLNEQGGNMVSFEIAGGHAAAQKFTEGLDLAFAPTLGDVATTVSQPASSSHRALTPEARARLGMSDGFFRVSVGIEDPDWLCEVFDRATAASQA